MKFEMRHTKKILDELGGYIFSNQQKLPNVSYAEKTGAPPSWQTFGDTQRWGGVDKHCNFKVDFTVPPELDGCAAGIKVVTGREQYWDATNPQFLAYVNGELKQALDVNHTYYILDKHAKAGTKYTLEFAAYSGLVDALAEMNIYAYNHQYEIERLYYNILAPYQVAVLYGEEDLVRVNITKYLINALNMLDLRIVFSSDFYKSVDAANQYLESEFYGKYCGHDNMIAHCVGHTHIDVAWQWRVCQTREKAVRSFATVINLMKEYPEYKFSSSQPQLYQFVKEENPKLYEEIKQRIKEGRWEAEGAMWLEADCNLASGESLVRQLIFGKRFFREEFGSDSKVMWLPDVFGYSAAMPQILKKSGVDYFVTSKLSWSEYNKMPYDTFNWKGIDGTEILSHFLTAKRDNWHSTTNFGTTYNAEINADEVIGAWERYQQKSLNNNVIVSYGWGDGGGGPTRTNLELAKRFSKGIPGCPKIEYGHTLDYLEKLEKNIEGKDVPTWDGELYLEYHRGTYTSMARNKKYNRKCEFALVDSETLGTIDNLLTGATYPASTLTRAWEYVLLNQFHDILPGSSIKEVYDDAKIEYELVTKTANQCKKSAVESIASKVNVENDSVVVFNTLGFAQSAAIEVNVPSGYIAADVPCQQSNDGKLLILAKDVPAKGYKSFALKQGASDGGAVCDMITPTHISTALYNITLDDAGNITSIYDKKNSREVLKDGARANVLQAFEDKPLEYDAWDINMYFEDKMWEVNDVDSVRVIENGSVRAGLEIKKRFLNSTIVQKIYVYKHSPCIDFVTDIDWKEKQILLKAAFPVDIHASKATFEIQYGNVERNVHQNTSWDRAKFEVCAHKWVDMSEGDYGVSMLNDCKYGHDIKNSVMRLTLLKSGIFPNPVADQEQHSFTYSIYPHSGGWQQANTAQHAYMLNCPMQSTFAPKHTGNLTPEWSLVQVDRDNVFVEVVKQAEDGNGVIVRLYEYCNTRSDVKLSFSKDVLGICECDMMENKIANVNFLGNNVIFKIQPYEIKTFRVNFK